ncbi:MAG: hypothetical protein WBG86_12810 [Polyangiales bacterium]
MEPPETPDPEEPLPLGEPAPGVPGLATPHDSALGFPLNRANATLGDIISTAAEAWRRDVGTWALATILVFLIGFGVPFVLGLVIGVLKSLLEAGEANRAAVATMSGLEAGVQVLQTIVNGVLGMGFWAMAIRGLQGEPAPIAALFGQIRKAFKYVLQILAIWIPLAVFFGGIAIIIMLVSVGGIDFDMPLEEAIYQVAPSLWWFAIIGTPIYLYVFLGIIFAQQELTYNDSAGPIEAILISWRIVRGRRWLILGTAIVSGLIALSSMLLCGVGFLFGGPLASLIITSLYLALRDGADVPVADTRSTLGSRA